MLKYDHTSYRKDKNCRHGTLDGQSKMDTTLVYGSPEAVVWDVEEKTHCLHCSCPRLHFSTWLLSLAESWPVNKVSQRAAIHGSARQQERWDRDESRPCLFLLLLARIGPRLLPLLVWLRRGRDLQRLQILQVPPVIKQSNMSWLDSPLQPVDRTIVVFNIIPRHTTLFIQCYCMTLG